MTLKVKWLNDVALSAKQVISELRGVTCHTPATRHKWIPPRL